MNLIKTVNVVVSFSGVLDNIYAWDDNDAGNEAANEKFRSLVKKNSNVDLHNEEIEVFLEDGYYDDGKVEIIISHSA